MSGDLGDIRKSCDQPASPALQRQAAAGNGPRLMAAAGRLRGLSARLFWRGSNAVLIMDSAPPAASETPPPEPVVLSSDRPVDYAVGAALWAAGVSWLVPMMGLQMLMHRLVGPDNMQWLERLYTRGQVFLTGSRWHAHVDPAIDPKRAYMFFQNHVNHLDHCTMYAATPHFKQGVELEDHFRYPVYGAFMRSRGTLPVKRGSARHFISLRNQMRGELERGHSLLVFPEGTRTVTGQLGDYQAGVFRIAVELQAPIIPVTVTGMYRVMRKGSLLIRPGYDVNVYCDAPIETKGLRRSDIPRLMASVREVM
ncbi:MAG TPA: lysophospholipid acyltransferase family protein, partial [Polyangiales bacterium]|nr:lysophospholipid acyltransferase family protein [Polyangiales bacterium]